MLRQFNIDVIKGGIYARLIIFIRANRQKIGRKKLKIKPVNPKNYPWFYPGRYGFSLIGFSLL